MQDVDDPNSGSTISLWTSEEKLRAYESSEVMKKIAATLTPYFAGQYDARISRVRHAQGDPAPSEWLSPLEC